MDRLKDRWDESATVTAHHVCWYQVAQSQFHVSFLFCSSCYCIIISVCT